MPRTAGSKTRNFPVHVLEHALVIIKAIVDKGAGKTMDRLLVADAVGRTPSSSEFKRLLSSSRQYGLTTGTEKADYVTPTELGLRIAKPQSEDEAAKGLVEACLKPDLFRKIYEQYNRAKLPDQKFLKNTLEKSFDVDASLSEEVASLIMQNGRFCGILQNVSGAEYIRIEDPKPLGSDIGVEEDFDLGAGEPGQDIEVADEESEKPKPNGNSGQAIKEDLENNRVFITHGKNAKILEQVKELVVYGKFEPVIAQERETAATPVPKKVMDDMRKCRAAVIHVGAEGILTDEKGNEVRQINGNVLIEIGAAMALYGDKFILLVEEGLKLPSNLQGLYECRYEGDELNMPATMKLLKAFNEF